jgi:hypothetical protein
MIDRLRRLSLALAPTFLIAGLFLGMGCDTDSASSAIDVSPSSVVLEKGESANFTASGGYEYTWSLDPDDGSGRLSTLTGPTVTYTCLNTNGVTPKKVVVTSTIEGTSTSSSSGTTSNGTTTTSAYSEQGFAQVYFPGGNSSSVSSLSIQPSSANVKTNAIQTFSAEGGTPAYSWTLSPSGSGTLTTSSGSATTYTAPSGTNSIGTTITLILKDSSGLERTATITIGN